MIQYVFFVHCWWNIVTNTQGLAIEVCHTQLANVRFDEIFDLAAGVFFFFV